MLRRNTFVCLNDSGNRSATLNKILTVRFVFVSIALVLLALSASAAMAAQAASADQAAESTFKSICATCHGEDGSGNTPVGKSMHIPDLHSAQIQSQSDEQLSEAISNGKNSMPPFKGSLKPDQIHQLVAHLRELGKKQ
jgi:mono/diheme cytochrome c family protein